LLFNHLNRKSRQIAGRIGEVGLTLTNQRVAEFGGDIMVDFVAGVTGVVLGILALIGVDAAHLVPAALIVFGAALLLAGGTYTAPIGHATTAPATQGGGAVVSFEAAAPSRGLQILIGIAGIVLGLLSLIFMQSWVLVLVGLLATGAALLMISATFSGAVPRLFTTS
jgi:hypothetical protein